MQAHLRPAQPRWHQQGKAPTRGSSGSGSGTARRAWRPPPPHGLYVTRNPVQRLVEAPLEAEDVDSLAATIEAAVVVDVDHAAKHESCTASKEVATTITKPVN